MVVNGTGLRRKPPSRMRGDRTIAASRTSGEAGQATLEFVALLPVLVLATLAMGQGAVAGYTQWSAAGAARAGARAQALGGDPAATVRKVLPAMLLRGHRVAAAASGARSGTVTVRLRVPSVVPGLRFGRVDAGAELPSQVAP